MRYNFALVLPVVAAVLAAMLASRANPYDPA
jgi:hypothetical protein